MIRRAWALLSVVPIFAGACVVLEWLTHSPALLQINLNYLQLGFNQAVCILLAGIALQFYGLPFKQAQYLQLLIGSFLIVFVAVTVSQDLLRINLYIDQMGVIPGIHPAFSYHPGRLAPNTALCLFLVGFIYIAMPMGKNRIVGLLVEISIFLVFLISVLALAGYIWKIEFLYGWVSYRYMALTNAICFVVISIALSGIWRTDPASSALYKGREDTSIILLSSAILLCMALAITIANFSSLIRQQDSAIGLSFERLQKSRSLFFQNEVAHAIQEMEAIRNSQLFQNEMKKSNADAFASNAQSILKLFAAEGFSAVSIYNDKVEKQASLGNFIQKAVFNVKQKITNAYINILWRDGWYVQIATDIDPTNNKAGLLVVEWPLLNLNKVFAPNQMMGTTGDISICMPASNESVTCFSSRTKTVSAMPSQLNQQFLPAHYALQGQTGLMTAPNSQYMQVLAAYGPIGELGLGIVVDMSVAEIYEPITKSLYTMIPAIAFTIIVGLLLLRLQAMPLLRRVINAERSLISSNVRLEESEKRYALAVRGSSIGLWDWDIANDNVFYSPYFKGLLGYSDAEFANTLDSFKMALHPDDYDRVFALVEQHIQDQVPYDIEYRLKRKTGDYHWFHAKGLALWDEQGNPLRMAGSVIDVTERKKSEQRLAAQYAVIQFLSTASSLEDVLGKILQALCENLEWDFGSAWLVDNQASVVRCIDLWYHDIPGIQPLVDVTRSAAFPIGEGLAGRVWETGQHLWVFDVTTEKNLLRVSQIKDAGLHSTFCFPIRIQNKVLGVLEFMMRQRQGPDEPMLKMMSAITIQIGQFAQRKAAEWSLRENEGYKAAILESASDSIITVNANGSVMSFNHRTSEIFGYSSVELSQSNIDLLMPDLAKKLKLLAGKMATEVGAKRKAGEIFPVEITVSKMFLSKQNVFVCIIRDITERKKIEKLKDEFVSVVGHELKTPITSIRGSIALLLDGVAGEFTEKAQELLEIANNNCERLLLLMNDIIDIEKIEAGKMDFQFKPTDITKLIVDAIGLSKKYGEQYKIKINFIAPESVIWVYVDPERLTKVLVNLISNAVQFSPEGDAVNIAVELREDSVRVIVSDHGDGVSEDFRSSIFQKFPQVSSSSLRGRGGIGMGLSISKAIVEKFGGTLDFVSESNKETAFYFDLPRWHQAEADEELTPALSRKITDIRLLICEEDEKVASELRTLLESKGYLSDVAHNSAQAKRMLQDHAYQVLLVVLALPDKGEIALIRSLCDDEKMQSLPVILISPPLDVDPLEFQGEAISVVEWLEKPVDFNKLLQSVEHLRSRLAKKDLRILHVENDTDTRRIISTLLHESAVLAEAESVEQARKMLQSEKFDFVILDFLLPDGNGAELLPILAECQLPIIIFSAVESDQDYARYMCEALRSSTQNNLLDVIRKVIESIH